MTRAWMDGFLTGLLAAAIVGLAVTVLVEAITR